MASLDIGLAFKLTTYVDILFGAWSEEDDEEVLEFLDVVLAIVEEMVEASPGEVGRVHGAKDRAQVHEIHFLIVDEFLLAVEHLVDLEVAGNVNLNDHVALAEQVKY